MTTISRCLAAAFAAILAGGCINLGLGGDPADLPEMHRHTLDEATGVTARAGKAPATSVRAFGARARYDIHVVRRDDADDFAYLDFERWGDPPADAVTDAVREALASSGAFTFVCAAGDALAVERHLDGYLLGFDLVPTKSGPWKARFEARLSLSDLNGRLLHSAVYETSRDLPGASPAGLGIAMGAAVGEAVSRALVAWDAAGLLR